MIRNNGIAVDDADAIAGDIAVNKIAYIASGRAVGTLDVSFESGNEITPSAIDQAVPAGRYDGSVADGKVLAVVSPFTAGDLVIYTESADVLASTDESYTKKRDIKIPFHGVFRVTFSLRTGSGGTASHGVIYINGTLTGIERENTSSNYADYTEDFTLDKDDNIQVYLKKTDGIAPSYNDKIEIKVSAIGTKIL